jgi:hypothetical protein
MNFASLTFAVDKNSILLKTKVGQNDWTITKFHTTSSRLTVTQINYSNIWKIFTWIYTFGFTDICSDVIYPDFWRCILIFLENSSISLNRVNNFTWNYKTILRFSIFNVHSIFHTVCSSKEQCTFTDRIDSVGFQCILHCFCSPGVLLCSSINIERLNKYIKEAISFNVW